MQTHGALADKSQAIASVSKENGVLSPRLRSAILGIAFLVSVFTILLQIPDPVDFATSTDWGYQLAGATNIIHGRHPFIDFHANYGPLTYYASALGQLLSGYRPIGELALTSLGYAAAYTLIFGLAWSISRRLIVAFPILLTALIMLPRYYKYYIVLGPILALWAIWYYIEHKNRKSLWLMGAAVAIAGLFRQDLGAYLALCIATVILLDYKRGIRRQVLEIVHFGISVVVCALPWLAFALVRGGLGTYFYDSTFAAFKSSESIHLPLRFFNFASLSTLISQDSVFVLIYLATFALLVIALFVILRGHGLTTPMRLKAFAVFLVSCMMLEQFFQRADYHHLLQAIPVDFVLAAFLAGYGLDRLPSQIGRLAVIGMISFTVLIGMSFIGRIGRNSQGNLCCDRSIALLVAYAQPIEGFLSEALASAPDTSMLLAEEYAYACTQDDEPILAWPNLTIVYYMAQREAFGEIMVFGPNYYDSLEDQKRTIAALSNTDRLNLIVFRPQTYFTLDEDRVTTANREALDNYLNEAFMPVQHFGDFDILVRKGASRDYTGCYNPS